jgi:L,D-transpeptidase catalytic domain
MTVRSSISISLLVWLCLVPAGMAARSKTKTHRHRSSSTVALSARTDANESSTPAPSPSPAPDSKPPAAPDPKTAAAPSPTPNATPGPVVQLVVSVPEQKLAVLVDGKQARLYRVSTSRYGEGDGYNSWQTPIGHLQVAHMFGFGAPAGAVFRRRQPTGEILAPDAPGRDPIVSRIIWLRGTEDGNKRAYERCIYIHGTPQETFLGRKASYGCIRMRSQDVIEMFTWIQVGTAVSIVEKPVRQAIQDAARETALYNNTARPPTAVSTLTTSEP